MSAPVPGGIQLAPSIYIFSGPGDPNTQASVTNSGPINAGPGSLWLRTDSPNAGVYVCTVGGTPPGVNGQPAVAGTWTLLS